MIGCVRLTMNDPLAECEGYSTDEQYFYIGLSVNHQADYFRSIGSNLT